MGERILIFGAGMYGVALGKCIIESEGSLLGYLDNKQVQSLSVADRKVTVFKPSALSGMKFDTIYISNESREQRKEIREQLKRIGIENTKIREFVEDKDLYIKVFSNFNVYRDYRWDHRIDFMRDFSTIAKEKNLDGCIAECGVFRGDFTK